MASQSFELPHVAYRAQSVNRREWDWSTETDDPSFDEALRPTGTDRRLQQLRLYRATPATASSERVVVMHVGQGVSDGFGTGDDLTPLFESQGSVTVTVGAFSITGLQRLSGDTTEQYRFDIGDGYTVAEFDAIWNAMSSENNGSAGTLIVRDFEPVAVAHSMAFGGRKIVGAAFQGRKLTGMAYSGRTIII